MEKRAEPPPMSVMAPPEGSAPGRDAGRSRRPTSTRPSPGSGRRPPLDPAPVLTFRPAGGRRDRSGARAEIAQLVEHATENRGVASSILALGTTNGLAGSSSGSGSVGRASPCQGEGRGFESRLPLHFLPSCRPGRCSDELRPSAPSSSGRTADFGSVRRGSNPRGAASLTRNIAGPPNRLASEATYPSG